MPLRIDILTLFPEMFPPILGTSIPKRAAEKGLVSYHLTNVRDFAIDLHKSVDDRPFGGGPGMVMMCQTMFEAVDAAERQDDRPATRILLSPQGRVLEHPQYTRPREFRGMKVPDVLLSGNHAAIARWRAEQRKLRTRLRLPDLW